MQSYVLLSEHKDKKKEVSSPKRKTSKKTFKYRIIYYTSIPKNILYGKMYFKTYFFEKKCSKENNVLKKSISLQRSKKTT